MEDARKTEFISGGEECQPEPTSWKHVGLVLGFYPLDWNIKPMWGPFVHTINLGPFALTFLF